MRAAEPGNRRKEGCCCRISGTITRARARVRVRVCRLIHHGTLGGLQQERQEYGICVGPKLCTSLYTCVLNMRNLRKTTPARKVNLSG